MSDSLKNALQYIANAHLGVSKMYELLAMTTIKDKEVFISASEKHKRMSDETLQAVLPDEG